MQTWLLHFQVATCVLRVLRLNSLDIALQPIPRYIVSSLTVMTAVMTCESPIVEAMQLVLSTSDINGYSSTR